MAGGKGGGLGYGGGPFCGQPSRERLQRRKVGRVQSKMLSEPFVERQIIRNKAGVFGIQSRFVGFQALASDKKLTATLQQIGHGGEAKKTIAVFGGGERFCAENFHGMKHAAIHGKTVSLKERP